MPKPAKRPVSGVLLLDKPIGMSSNAALQSVKRLYGASKAGHTGSLDPLASGLLPICLGEATKIAAFVLNADKGYRFSCRLGVTTTTGDAEGEVLHRRPVPPLTRATVEPVLARFTGEIEQLPPMYSALKHQGRPLYELARQGLEVERRRREVIIHSLRLIGLEGDRLDCEVHCSKGTYVRTLAEDLGEALRCGAHVIELRRTTVKPYRASQMVTLETLRQLEPQGHDVLDALLLPLDTALASWPVVHLQGIAKTRLLTGQPVAVATDTPPQSWVRLYGNQHRFLGIGEILDDGRVAPRRLIQGVSD